MPVIHPYWLCDGTIICALQQYNEGIRPNGLSALSWLIRFILNGALDGKE